MSSKKVRGLGRGLDALMPKPPTLEEAPQRATVQQLAVTLLEVSPYQPRSHIDPQALAELSASIADKGVLQPLLVRPLAKGRYEIVAGERRFRAAMQAGLQQVPALVQELNDRETLEIAIIENLQREDLDAMEEARAFARLLEFDMSQAEVAQAVGRSRSAVANALRLLQLPEAAQQAISQGLLSAGHGRAILRLAAEHHMWALQTILRKDLSVRQAEALVPPDQDPEASPGAPVQTQGVWQQLEYDLSRHVGTRVTVAGKKQDKGRLELHFHSRDELERLLSLLGYQP